MSVEFLVAGALITCPLGTTQEQVLLIPDDHGTYVDGKLVAREIDCEPIKNIAPFGICTFTQKPCFPDFAGKQWINTHADSCLTGGKEAATTESRLYCLTGKKLLIPTDSGQGPICPEEASDFELWLLDAKEYLQQMLNSAQMRADKAFDSPQDFMDWLTMGMTEGLRSRYEKLVEDPNVENFFNWLSLGFVDTVKGAVNPEKPLSLEHWLDSLGVATTIYGGYKLTEGAIAGYSKPVKIDGPTKVKNSTGWDMIEGGGKINGREYSQHAMERMAPDTPSVRAELSRRADKLAKSKGIEVGSKGYYELHQKYVDPRNIPPIVVENAISSTKGIPGNALDTFIHETIDVKVIVNSSGKVITVIPK